MTEHSRRQAHPVAVVERTTVDGIRGAVGDQALVINQDRQARADDVDVRRKEWKGLLECHVPIYDIPLQKNR